MFCLSLCLAELCVFNSFKLSLLINAIRPLIILELFFEHRPAGFHKPSDEQPAADAVFQGPSPCCVSECSAPNHSSLILCHIITETNVLFSAFISSYVFGFPACVSVLPQTSVLRIASVQMEEKRRFGTRDPALPLWLSLLGKSPSTQGHFKFFTKIRWRLIFPTSQDRWQVKGDDGNERGY